MLNNTLIAAMCTERVKKFVPASGIKVALVASLMERLHFSLDKLSLLWRYTFNFRNYCTDWVHYLLKLFAEHIFCCAFLGQRVSLLSQC